MKNDSAIAGVGGSLTLLKGEHPTVQMVREKIAMVLEPKNYETTVDFVFKNSGPATKVLMGFPESGSGDVQKLSKSQMLAFSTWVDGTKTTARWVPVKSESEEHYEAHWVKEVSFAANQVRNIRVRYRSEYGGSATNGLKDFVSYNFTGANWKGKVEESELTLTFKRPGSFMVAATIEPKGGTSGAVALVPKGATVSRTWRNWEAQADFTMAFGTAPATWRTVTSPGMEGEETPIPGAILLPSSKIRTITTPGTPAQLAIYDWCPPAFDQGGDTLIAVGFLEQLFGGKWEITPEDPTTSATLKCLGHTLTFQAGKRTATVDGKTVPLPIAARTLKNIIPDTDWLYVPVSVVAKALGQKYEALKDSRTLRIIQ